MTGKRRNRRAFGKPFVVGSVIAASLIFGQAGAAAGMDQGAQLAAACASCHRLDGGDKGIPSIIGLDQERFTSAMLAYRASESPSHIMHAIALSLSDEEIATLAHYVATQGK